MKKALWLKYFKNEKITSYKKLKGGVSSEVYKIKTSKNIYCIKRSLKKLLVKKDWYADTSRIKYEYLWLKHCKNFIPNSVPKLYYYNDKEKYFSLEYFDERKFRTLKELFFKRLINKDVIKKISLDLQTIHLKSANIPTKKIFSNNNKNFYDLRLDAYFNEIGRVHVNLQNHVRLINKNYYKFSTTLVHGDFSPKNILVNNKTIKIIDAETCNFGDPVFDLVFFTNHLLIKSLIIPEIKEKLLESYLYFYNIYFSNLKNNEIESYLKRIIKMTPIMLLARVDGKSPVEYIHKKNIKDKIRQKSMQLINTRIKNLKDIVKIIND